MFWQAAKSKHCICSLCKPRTDASLLITPLRGCPCLSGIIGVMTDCIRDVGFSVDHRLWTEILAVAARDSSVRETFAASDKAMRVVFVELLHTTAEVGEIDDSLDFDAVSVWLYRDCHL